MTHVLCLPFRWSLGQALRPSITIRKTINCAIYIDMHRHTSIIWSLRPCHCLNLKKNTWAPISRGIVVVQVESLVRTWQNAWNHKQHGDYIVAHLWVGWFWENICVGLHGVASCVGDVMKQLESEQLPTLQQQFCFARCQKPEWYYTIINDIASCIVLLICVLVTKRYGDACPSCLPLMPAVWLSLR